MKSTMLRRLFAIILTISLVSCVKNPEDTTVHVTDVTLNPTSLELNPGDVEVLTATVSPSNATNKTVLWITGNAKVATVSDGTVMAVGEGETTITAKSDDGGITATCSVKVVAKEEPVTGISLNKTKTEITQGDSEKLEATISPSTAIGINLLWSSDNSSVASVDANGNVTAVSVGNAIVTVKTSDGKVSASCEVVVKAKSCPVTGVALNEQSIVMQKGENRLLVATVTPSNATNITVIWTSSNTSVATVDENGMVTAVNAGSAQVVATTEDGGYSSQCEVTVRVGVAGISLNRSDLSIAVGGRYTLKATVTPSNATNKNLQWLSNNPSILSVDQNGVVTALSAGSATVFVTTEDGGFSASCNILVKAVPVAGLTININSETIIVGEQLNITPTITPDNATNKQVEWSSSAEDVVTISNNGVVIAVHTGAAVITAKTEDGGFSAECLIIVAGGVNNGHYWVDLGLPSETKWATCNVGANSPTESGEYFAWGETEPKNDYSWATYKWCEGASNSLTKYNYDAQNGIVDNLPQLEISDDAACVNWEGTWRMPSKEQTEELALNTNCKWTWVQVGTVKGYTVTSRVNGNSIFIPASGRMYGRNLHDSNVFGEYWTNVTWRTSSAISWMIGQEIISAGGASGRFYGQTVRPVCE